MLTVLSRADRVGKLKMWLCRCDCGNESAKAQTYLRCGDTTSCGCRQYEAISKSRRTHGESHKTAEYKLWLSMRDRCNNAKNKKYSFYGGRGIRVCERWNDYSAFLADMGRRPTPKHQIDRYPDQDGNYEPGNCRWVTCKENQRNRRSNRLVTFNGETLPVVMWAERLGLNYATMRDRFETMTVERAITMRKGERHDSRKKVA